MSQPLKSSWARRPSSRYTAGELAPPLWNWTLMSRPIAAEGTCRYSTGRPGRENAPAVAGWPTTPISPGNRAAPKTPTASRRGMLFAAPRNLSTSLILASSFFVGPNTVGRTASPLAKLPRKPLLGPHRRRTAQLRTCSQPHLGVWLLLGVGPSPGPAPRPSPLSSAAGHHAVNVPMSGRAPVRLHIRRCWGTVGAVDTALTGCRPKWLT